MYVRQVLFTRHANYSQLAYRDDNGVEHLLINATYCNSSGTPVGGSCGANGVPSQNYTSTTEAYWNGTLYTASGTTTRLNALKVAMNEFVNTVAAQENEDGSKPNHRVAIVGFAGSSDSNTELLTGINLDTSASNKSGIRYSRLGNDDYKEALLDVTNSTQLTKLRNAVQALDANGGTEGQYGFYMAKNILDQRELTKFTTKGGSEVDRLTIVVYFTDGTPGNYDNDNQYAFGNEVVDAAHQLKTDTKVPNVEIYSIGTFGFADSEPLVYEKYTGNNDEYKFDPDYVKTLSGTWQSGYMYRLWLRNTQGYGDVATDTVYDYMRTITTEYPNATKFVDASWYGTGTKSDNGVYTNMVSRVRGASNGLRRYFLCTDLSGLSRVFTTIGSEEASSSTQVTLDSGAVLHDTVNTTYFDTANASVSAYTVAAYKNGTFGTEPIRTWPTGSDKLTFDKTTGEVTVSDFNYSEKYVNSLQDGEKLVVKITGLTANQPGENMPSNDGNAYIKAPDAEASAIEIASPTLTLNGGEKSFVIDFSAPMTVANQVSKLGATTGSNGEFTKSGSNVTYRLKGIGLTVGGTADIALSGVDTAMVYGVPVGESGNPAWNKITTIPAGSVYFDDDLTAAISVGDGSGYNAGVTATPTDENTAKGRYTFTFNGTGIDVYCTTNTDGGMVQYMIDGNMNTAEGVRNYSITERYNVPTISIRDLSQGEHTLTINVLGSSNYKLDGIRVYNPVSNATYDGQGTHEQYAAFINLREALVNDNGVDQAFTDSMTEAVLGALFIDDTTKLNVQKQAYDAETGEFLVDENKQPIMIDAYESEFVAYKENSPKHEIYLKNNQAITFVLTADAAAAAASGNLWIGLSAPDKGKQGGTVEFKAGETQQISTAVDEYYPITPDRIGANNTITIKNTGNNMISVTNLKITGNQTIYNAANTPKAGTESVSEDAVILSVEDVVPMVFAPVTMQTVKIAANDGVDPDAEPTTEPSPEPTPDPTPDPTEQPAQNWLSQLISNFVSMLFRSISRLFGN